MTRILFILFCLTSSAFADHAVEDEHGNWTVVRVPPQDERYSIEPWLRQPLDQPICVPVTVRVNTYSVRMYRRWDGSLYEVKTLIATRCERRYLCDQPCGGCHERLGLGSVGSDREPDDGFRVVVPRGR